MLAGADEASGNPKVQALRISPRRRRGAILSLHDVRSADWLAELLAGMAREARFVSLPDFVARFQQPEEAAFGNLLALTFDDGNKSIRTVVEPVCARLGIPFTTFVCGEVLRGGPAPWFERLGLLIRQCGPARVACHFGLDELRAASAGAVMSALKTWPHPCLVARIEELEVQTGIDPEPLRERFMTVDDLAAVARNPLATIGSHTYSHPILANLSAAQQGEEIRRGLAALRGLVPDVRYFAYPNGKPIDFNDSTMAHLRANGVAAAVTTVQRPARVGDDLMQLPRLGVSEGDSVLKIQLKWALPWPGLGDRRELRMRRQAARYAAPPDAAHRGTR